MGRFIILGAALAILWLLLSGYFDEPLLLSFGAASVALSAWLARRAGMLDPEGVPGGVFPGILVYMPWLVVEIAKANIAVARHALAVEPKLSPMMIRVPATQTSTVGRVIFANSITLTPGTVSIDLDDDCILVHALTEALGDEAALADMGARAARIERRRA